ncbi:MAG: hypothetical protein J5634_03720 [Bacilli bacterium]|nr:hypothetical protein [Bacilli bacterium]
MDNTIMVSKRITKEEKRIFVESYIFEFIRLKEELNTKYYHKLSTYYELSMKNKYKITSYVFDRYKDNLTNLEEYMSIVSSLIYNQYLCKIEKKRINS